VLTQQTETTDGWTVADMAVLERDFPKGYRYEMADGVLEVTPPPLDRHEELAARLGEQLSPQARPEWNVRYVRAVQTLTGWRHPDVLLLRAAAEVPRGARLRPGSHVGLAVEVESPTSLRRDRIDKLREYAEIGIPHYWRMESDPELAVVAYELVGTSYDEVARISEGHGPLPGPVPLAVDLEAMRQG